MAGVYLIKKINKSFNYNKEYDTFFPIIDNIKQIWKYIIIILNLI